MTIYDNIPGNNGRSPVGGVVMVVAATGQRTMHGGSTERRKKKQVGDGKISERVQVSVWTTYGRPIIAIDEVHMDITTRSV